MASREDEWLHGWDETPGIVSVWAWDDGRVRVWRRIPGTGALVVEEERFRPWALLDSLADVEHAGTRVTWRELEGAGLRYQVSAESLTALTSAVLGGASRRLGRSLRT